MAGRPTLVTCFRVGAVVQAGGETKGIGRRDWPVVSCRAEPPLVRCDGSQASAICGRRSPKVIAAAGDRRGAGADGLETAATRGTLRAAPTPALTGTSDWAEFASSLATVATTDPGTPPEPDTALLAAQGRNLRRRRRDANERGRGSRRRARPPLDCRRLLEGTGGRARPGPWSAQRSSTSRTALLYRPAGQRRWRSRKSSVARLKVSGSSCSPACDRWSKTTRSHPLIRLLIRRQIAASRRGHQPQR